MEDISNDIKPNILVVEDDQDVADLIVLHVRDMGWTVSWAADGQAAVDLLKTESFDIVLLDLMLPKLDGMEVCRRIRETDPALPVMAISAKNQEIDVVLAYRQGVDDYVSKPFRIGELLARIKGLLRRHALLQSQKGTPVSSSAENLCFGSLTIDLVKREVSLEGKQINLTRTEFDLLAFLAAHPGRPFTRGQLLDKVWGYQYGGYEHAVTSHVNRLRAKLEVNPEAPRLIKTVWGVGYCFAEPS
jgi:DNA-binding response OmpR family regulator